MAANEGLGRSPKPGPIPAARVHFPAEDIEELSGQIAGILESGRLTLGPYTEQFERGFSAAHHTKHGVAVNSGTSALEAILRALRIEDADVIVPTNTFAATAFAVLHSGNRLVLADVNQDLFIDPTDLEARITPRTKAIIAVHIGGRVTPDILALETFCKERNFALIEDAAHAHGSRLADRPAGTFGTAAAFSFYPTKVMTSGEGGMVLTDDPELASTVRTLRDQGKAGFSQNFHTEMGYNWRMSEFHACIGMSQLRRMPEFIETRRKVAAVYDAGLENEADMSLLREREGMHSNYYKYIALLDPVHSRAKVKDRLRDEFHTSLSGEVYELPLHEQPFVQRHTGEQGLFPNAIDLCRRHICLPVHAVMTEAEARFVVDSLKEVLA